MNKAVLIVADMGLEIPVPSTAVFNTPTINIAVRPKTARSPRILFQITKRPNGDYLLHKYEFLREALEYLYSCKESRLLKDVKSATGIDISNAMFMEGQCDYSTNLNTMDLKLYLTSK